MKEFDKAAALTKVRQLKKEFDSGNIPHLHNHEVNPGLPLGDRINYLYFTLPVSINFQRNSPAMWQSALKTYNDPETNYLFFPERVAESPREKIQQDLIKHRLGLQLNKHTDIWRAISATLHQYFHDDPRELLALHEHDVNRIVPFLRIEHKKDFPYLSGAKMANYWLYILHNFTDIKLQNLAGISIIPDTHVLQASQVLGLTDDKAGPEEVAAVWQKLLEGSELSPIDMHPVLWNWSRANFKPEV